MSRTRPGFEETVAPSVTTEPKATVSTTAARTSARILTLDRSNRSSGPAVNPDLRVLIERAVVDATNAWTASDADVGVDGSAYASLSTVGEALTQALAGGNPELRGWPPSGSCVS